MYKTLIRPFLFSMSPEKAHYFTFQSLKILQNLPGGLSVLRSFSPKMDNPVELMGLTFPNRVGLAAGLDKNAELIPVWEAMGFGFAEIGTLTPKPQPGNPKPRSFRLVKDQALINRMGFNNVGVDKAVKTIREPLHNMIVGGNIGKNTLTPNENAIEDYLYVFNALYDHVDYIVVNVSCPNITDLGKLQDKDHLDGLLREIDDKRREKQVRKPLVLKLSPDLNNAQIGDTLELITKHNFDGIIATNTSISRDGLRTPLKKIEEIGNGGLSGRPLLKRSTEKIRFIRKELGKEFPIIGSGGIIKEYDAEQMLEAGADVLQLYTGFIYEGIRIINRCLRL